MELSEMLKNNYLMYVSQSRDLKVLEKRLEKLKTESQVFVFRLKKKLWVKYFQVVLNLMEDKIASSLQRMFSSKCLQQKPTRGT